MDHTTDQDNQDERIQVILTWPGDESQNAPESSDQPEEGAAQAPGAAVTPVEMEPDEEENEADAAPARTVFKPLFFCALIAVIALAGVCAWLLHQRQSTLSREDELTWQITVLEQTAADLREEVDFWKQALADAQDAAAVDVDVPEQSSTAPEQPSAAPEVALPEYAQLYPDLYAPEWTGETITGGSVCCLTFDDGPSANTDRVLEILDRYGVKATFFVVGKTGEADQERMRKIVAAGHTIAMHSWSHNYRNVYASVGSFLEEFNDLYQWIYDVTGVYPQVYRFPGGSINSYNRGVYQEIIAEMTRRGFVYFDWNASAQDATSTPRSSYDIAADCLKGLGKDLVVVLCHDSAARGTTVDALPAVIEGYRAAGYTFSALNPGVRPITFGYPAVQ